MKRYEFQNMCCEYGFFTCGDNCQYAKVMDMLELFTSGTHCTHSGFDALVYMTWICSDVDMVLLCEVRVAMKKLFHKLGIAVR